MPQTPPRRRPESDRYLVLLAQDDFEASVRHLGELAQINVRHTGEAGAEDLAESCAVVFDRIGAAYVRCAEPARQRLTDAVAQGNRILAIEPERTVYAIAGASGAKRSARVKRRAGGAKRATGTKRAGTRASAQAAATWGVRAVRADLATRTGLGMHIAILDTGLDLSHPDFAGRDIHTRSFVPGETVQDGNGHGTHCAGIAAGPAQPRGEPRYGVAGQASLYIGKVLSNQGSGGDGGILQGIEWAVGQNCQVISMSLGSPAQPGQGYSRVFEGVAQRALAAGTLIVAAAGNESERPGYVAPVGHPANCPSIMAIAALKEDLRVAPFSDGGKIALAAPGVDVLSAWPAPELHRTLSGTSMATPFVAGVAALYAEADPQTRATRLAERLGAGAKALPEPASDVGAGLVQAPKKQARRASRRTQQPAAPTP